jgi:hypothetical protein
MRRPALVVLLLPLLLVTCRSGPTTPRVPSLAITTESLPPAVRGEPYARPVYASGGDGAYQWDLVAGRLPTGLALGVDDLAVDHALITGTPEVVETTTFTLRLRSGDGQSVQRAFTLAVLEEAALLSVRSRKVPPALAGAPYAVRLRADGGDGVSYTWAVVEGSLPPGLSLNADGRFQGTPTTPGESTFVVEVRSGGLSERHTLTLRVVANDGGAYRITLFPVSDLPQGLQFHVEASVARWEAAVVGNLQAIAIPENFFGSGDCGGFGWMMNGAATDDILIALHIVSIDGPGGVLGRAGPCGVRTANELPFVGVVILDADDLLPLVGTETLTDLITHEIGHALGFGVLWNGLLTGAGGSNPRFTGPRAVAEYRALGGTGDVPVENQGGEETRDSHWRKSVFRRELMTGFAEPVGIAQPLSRVSIASLGDLGYTVDLAAAEEFTLTSAVEGWGWQALGHDEVLRDRVLVLGEDGEVRVLERR